MNRLAIVVVAACALLAVSCENAPGRAQHASAGVGTEEQGGDRTAVMTPFDVSAPVSQPAATGNGLAAKAVCAGNTGVGGNCTVPGQLNTVARAVTALNAPVPTAVPPTAAQVISFVSAGPVDWTDFQGFANGVFSTNLDLRGWFGQEVYQVPYSFAGYVAIPASSTPTTKSFAVGSDDGFAMNISNGTQIYTYTHDAPRSFATGGTPGTTSGTAPPAGSTLQVTFPASDAGVLYPIDLVFYEASGQEGVELSWANGSVANAPDAGSLNGFSLIPQSSLYAPDVRAVLWAQNTDNAAGPVQIGTDLTYTAQISNVGTVLAKNLTFTVVLPTALTSAGTPSGCTVSTGTLSCPIASLAAGASTNIAFNTVVSNSLVVPDGGTTVVDVQGVVQGLATAPDFSAGGGGLIGDTSQIYVYTDDPAASAPLTGEDTGNSPASITGVAGLVDDDPTRFTIGQALPQPPAITAPSTAVSPFSAVTLSGTSTGYPVGTDIRVTISGPVAKTCTATVAAGGVWACGSRTLPDGSYSAIAQVVNAAGMGGQPSAPFAFAVSAPPAPVLITPAVNATVRQSQVLLAGTAAVPAGTSITVTTTDSFGGARVCTASVQADQSWVCAQTLNDGGYSWTAAVEELYGSFGPSATAQNFSVNTAGLAAPTIAQTSPSPTKQTQPLLSGTAQASDSGGSYKLVVYDANSTPVCTVNPATANWSCTPAAPLADGTHTLTAFIVDGSGYSSPPLNVDVFVVDTTAPAAPTLAAVPTPSNQTQPTFSGTGEPGASLVVKDGSNNTLCTATVQSNGDWSCQPSTALAPGSYTATAKQTDAAGNTSLASAPIAFVIDTTPPGAPTINPPNSPTDVNTVPLTGTADPGTTVVVRDQSGAIVCGAISVPSSGPNAGKWSCTTSVLPDGTETLTATSTDAAGNSSSSSPVSLKIDTVAPAAPVLVQTASPTANTTPTFSGTAEPKSTVTVSVGGSPVCTAAVANNGAFSCTSTTVLAGAPASYTATAVATDAAGNTSLPSNSDTFVVDTTVPAAPTLDPLPAPPGGVANTTDSTQPTFNGTGTPGDTVSVETAPGGALLCTGVVASNGTWFCTTTAGQAISGNPPTQVTVQAVQTTPAGVTGGASAPETITVATAAPGAPTIAALPAHEATATPLLHGTADVGTTLTVRDESGRVICVVAPVPAGGDWSCTPAVPLHEGTNTLTAVSVGPSGLASAPSNSVSTDVDTLAPLAPVLQQTASPTANAEPTFTGTAQPGSSVGVFEGSTLLCTATADATTGVFSCAPATPLADGAHTVAATATDEAGNTSAPSNGDVFTVDTTVPPPPVISEAPVDGGEPGVSASTNPVLSGTGVPGDTVTVSTGSQTLCTAVVQADGSWSCTSTVALPGNPAATYPLSATQTTPAGNTSTPGTGSITVDTTATAAPTLDQPVSPTRSHSQTFTGTGTAGDTLTVYAGPTALCTTPVKSDGSWSCAPAAPLADGTYLLVAAQVGEQGTPSAPSAVRSLVIDSAALPAPTLDQPNTPTEQNEPILSGTAQPGATVTVTDPASGDVICSAVTGNSGSWSCTPTTPLSEGTHSFVATQADAAGNSSPPSAQRTIVVTSPDGLPHVAISSPIDGAQLTGQRPQITGTSTPGTTVQATLDGVVYQAQSAPNGDWALTPDADLAPGQHTVTAVATDAGGTSSQSASATFDIYLVLRAQGGCASGGVPSPVLALLALLLVVRMRRRGRKLQPLLFARSGLRRGALALSLAAAALVASPARAQSNFNLETFRPAAAGDGYAGVEGARPPTADDADGKLDLKLWLDGTNRPLVVVDPDGASRALVRNRYDGWLSGQVHLYKPLSISVELPFLLGQHGDLSYLPPSARGPSSFSASLGDVRLTPRVSLLRQESAGLDLAAQASVELPTGSTSSLSSDKRVDAELLASAGHRFYLSGPGSFELLGNVFARLRPPREILDVLVGNSAGLRLALGYYLGAESKFIPHRVFGEVEAQSYLRGGFTSGQAPAEWRAGATWCFGLGFALDGAVGTGIGNGVGAPAFRGLIGIGYSPASCRAADRDGDGVPDRDDQCPTVPGLRERAGCPAPPDRDHDGVPDSDDACPDEPGLKENRGCPANHDRDGDGVPDLIDRCPDVPGPASNQGCPEPQKPAECAPPPPLEIALPLVSLPPPPPDRDHDGVPDAEDNCPDQPGPASNHGCPETVKQLVVLNGEKLDILEKVYFATNKSIIQPRSFPLLDQVAQLLKSHPELTRLEVQGHTDNVGDPKKNQALSQARAQAVVDYLVRANIEQSRLVAKGYGQTQPLVPNNSKSSREKNRRVEFHVLEGKQRAIQVEQPAAVPSK